MGHNGRIIIDIIPEVERIIGPRPDVRELEPNEVKNRLNKVFENFINVLQENPGRTG